MTAAELFVQITKKRSFLCVGLDTDIRLIPEHIAKLAHPQFEFNRRIVDATAHYAVCYKPNLAFYEESGVEGWQSFVLTCEYIRKNYPEIFIIADAKRGDIGNTSHMYARTFFENNLVDAVTLSPYMGEDTVKPFLEYKDKWAIILALTSNPSAVDFETLPLHSGRKLYEQVIETSSKWGSADNTMYVVGATQASMLETIRNIIPNHFLLIPGVGAQGGSLSEVAQYGMNNRCGLLVNSSRGIIYAGQGEQFVEAATQSAETIQKEMKTLLSQHL